jgi:hypothetical protein
VIRITFQDGKVVMRDGQVGTEEACCCGGVCCVDCGRAITADFVAGNAQDAAAFLAGLGYTNALAFFTAFGTTSVLGDCCVEDQEAEPQEFIFTEDPDQGNNQASVFVLPCLQTTEEGTVCIEGLTSDECGALFGQVVAASSCTPDPCCDCQGSVTDLRYILRITLAGPYGINCVDLPIDIPLDGEQSLRKCQLVIFSDIDVDFCDGPIPSCAGVVVFINLVPGGCDCETGEGCVLELAGYEEQDCFGGIQNVELIQT